MARKGRLKWWPKAGGDAQHVVEGGLTPSIKYGMAANGIPPTVMRDMRRLRGACARVKSGGSSLTAKLALAGHKYAEADHSIVYVAPTLRFVLAMLWDFPRTRFAFVYVWRRAVREIIEADKGGWQAVAGPVGAAMCHLKQIGVKWSAPSRLQWNDIVINILDTPPSDLSRSTGSCPCIS